MGTRYGDPLWEKNDNKRFDQKLVAECKPAKAIEPLITFLRFRSFSY